MLILNDVLALYLGSVTINAVYLGSDIIRTVAR